MKKVFSAEEKRIFDMYMADRGQFPEVQNPRMRKKEDLLLKKLNELGEGYLKPKFKTLSKIKNKFCMNEIKKRKFYFPLYLFLTK